MDSALKFTVSVQHPCQVKAPTDGTCWGPVGVADADEDVEVDTVEDVEDDTVEDVEDDAFEEVEVDTVEDDVEDDNGEDKIYRSSL